MRSFSLKPIFRWKLPFLLLGVCSLHLFAQDSPDFTGLSLEELVSLDVTSVSKKAESLTDAPAAIYVLSGEDVRRSGATTIAEALRMVPGLQVSRIQSGSWAVGSRGFQDRFANKLLVLVDGRSVYTPLNSGVYWELQDVLMEDLDRIEVIRGPGAALWGANAVNGVINITTKSARETQGGLVTAGFGTEEEGFGAVRYGGKLADDLYFRIYGKAHNRDELVTSTGAPAGDEWAFGQGGFRVDWHPSDVAQLTVQGDYYYRKINSLNSVATTTPPAFRQISNDDGIYRGANLVTRWTRELEDGSSLKLQSYLDHASVVDQTVSSFIDTWDSELQYDLREIGRHDVVTGLGHRLVRDEEGANFITTFTPPSRTTHLLSWFAQDRITLIEDRLKLTLGIKVEANDYTGLETQPNVRLAWTPNDRQTVWASVARAVRTPSVAEESIRLQQPGPLPGTVVRLNGNSGLSAEELIAYELGYRIAVTEQVSVDVALFYNQYDKLRTLEPEPVIPGVPTFLPFRAGNLLEGETYGGELLVSYEATDWWRLESSYSYLDVQLHLKPGSADPTTVLDEGRSPEHQLTFRSLVDLGDNWELDSFLRYVSRLSAVGVPGYVELDVRVGWRPMEDLELSLVGQNLLDSQHPEFDQTQIGAQSSEAQRGFYGRITWEF